MKVLLSILALAAAPQPPSDRAAENADDTIVVVGNLQTGGELVESPYPAYPKEAKRAGQEGLVLLAVVVAKNGSVKEAAIERSSGHRLLDQAALATIRRWKWNPWKVHGKPIQVRGNVTLGFSLRH